MKRNILAAFLVPHPPLIIPEVGRGEEKAIQKTIDAYRQIAAQIVELKPSTICVISPHATTYSDYFHISSGESAKGDFGSFHAPQAILSASYDSQLVANIAQMAQSTDFPAGVQGERNKHLDHGTMIPLHFINEVYRDYKLIRLSISGLPYLAHYEYGKLLQKVFNAEPNRSIVFIASGDLSHMLKEDGPYGFAKEGPAFDEMICSILRRGSFLDLFAIDPVFAEAAGECGLRSIFVMAGILDGYALIPKLLSYEGPFGVGYAVASFSIREASANRHFDKQYRHNELTRLGALQLAEDQYIKLARQSLEYFVKNGHAMQRPSLDGELTSERAGAFVSLKKYGVLRGCIGTIHPTTSCLADEIIQNAVSAGTDDPRFPPVTAAELPYLVYDVDVMGAPEPISSLDELDPRKYGVIVRSGSRSGLLLPDLEGIDTAKEQVAIALEKAGIRDGEHYAMERFVVTRHK